MLYSEARAQLDNQLSGMDAIDAKIGVLFALGGAEAALGAAALALPRPKGAPTFLLVVVGLLVVVLILSYGALAYWAISALRMVKVWIGPALEPLASRYAEGEAPSFVKARAIRTLRDHYLDNERRISRPKEQAFARTLIALVIETTAVVLAFALLSAASLFPSSGPEAEVHPAGSPATGSSRLPTPAVVSAGRQLTPEPFPRQSPSSP